MLLLIFIQSKYECTSDFESPRQCPLLKCLDIDMLFLPIELPCEPSPLMIRRVDDIAFRVGYGARVGDGLEDGLVIFAQPTWGFFGVFGGHGGDQSRFITTRIEEELLKSGMPEDNAAVTALALRLDEEFSKKFLGSNPSASDFTGTFVIVKAPSTQESSLAVFSKCMTSCI